MSNANSQLECAWDPTTGDGIGNRDYNDARYEADLGNPAADGYVLTSTAAGVRSWSNLGGGGPEADTLDTVTTRGNTTANAISTGNHTVTGVVNASVGLIAPDLSSTGNLVISTAGHS